jgi:hypothetical protein
MSIGSSRIQQIYGYLVCLIAIITLLISASSLTNAILDLTRPEGVGRYGEFRGPDGSGSYEEYRLSQLERATAVQEKTGRTDVVLDDSTMRRQYNEQRTLAKASERWLSTKTIVTSSLMIVIALVLFMIHWRWLRSIAKQSNNNG